MKFHVLESLQTGQRFYSIDDGRDVSKMNDGSPGYKVIHRCSSDFEAQAFLFGERFALREELRRRQEKNARRGAGRRNT